MKLSFIKNRQDDLSISLTPLIDVVFILLIFFMLASSFLNWKQVEVRSNNPSSSITSPVSESIFVLIQGNSSLTINGSKFPESIAFERLRDLVSNDLNRQIVIQAEEGIPMQRTMDILMEVRHLGFQNYTLSE